MKHTDLLIEQIYLLRQMKLPPAWSVAKLDVEFVREGHLEEWGKVVYDSLNNVFYVQTNKCICYPEEVRTLTEGVSIMKKANEIIQSPWL